MSSRHRRSATCELLDFGAGRKLERNIAAMFIVDMSGSTRGWINEAEREARGYLPHVYGAVNDTVIDEVRTLPLKVPDIYRRLTT